MQTQNHKRKKKEPIEVLNTWELHTKIGAISNHLDDITPIKQYQEHRAVFECTDKVKMAPSALI